MFKFNKMTDYATVVLIEIARGAKVRSSHRLAAQTGIPLPTVSKLLKSLGRSGLVESHRGVAGGYTLGHAPQRITIADVIQAVEGPIALTACADTSNEECSIQTLCPVQGKWNRVNTAIRSVLADVTLADMVADMATVGLERTKASPAPAAVTRGVN